MENSIIKFAKTRDVLNPDRGYKTSAGIDFFVPKFDKTFIQALKEKNPKIFSMESDSDNGTIYLSNSGGHSICNASSSTLTLSSAENKNKVEFILNDENDTLIKFDEEKGKLYFVLPPLSRVNIPSGIYCKMESEGRALIAANKSGIASKNGIIFGAQVVDYEYQGEIHINVINTSSEIVRIYEDQKLIQFVETPIFTSDIKMVPTNKLYDVESERKDGGFGSTDKKEKK